jgi:hypothetical protein
VYRTLAAAALVAAGLLPTGCGQRSATKAPAADGFDGSCPAGDDLPQRAAARADRALSKCRHLIDPDRTHLASERPGGRPRLIAASFWPFSTPPTCARSSPPTSRRRKATPPAHPHLGSRSVDDPAVAAIGVNAQRRLAQARQTLAKDALDLSRYKQLMSNGYIARSKSRNADRARAQRSSGRQLGRKPACAARKNK